MRVDFELSPSQREHAARVSDRIAQEIEMAGGWIGFERYMELALYAPGLGYYSAGARKLGVGGDFTTAPEISPLFGACVAQQCAEILGDIEAGRTGCVLEVGAGSGALAVDILARLQVLHALPLRYAILEVSADLRARQRALVNARIPHLAERIRWLDAPPAEPFDGVVLANEVLDALPVMRFRWRATGCEELGVACADGGFAWSARPGSVALTQACRRFAAAAGGWEDGYVSEYCPRLAPWAQTVARSVRRGAALWIDYGLPRAQYYLPERHDGTLICHLMHRLHDNPFIFPGLSDISAWVDFSALAEAGRAAGWTTAGFTTQAFFLAGLGIEQEMQTAADGDGNRFARLANQARRLMLPGEMGERFKAMVWTRGVDTRMSGFALQDLRHSL